MKRRALACHVTQFPPSAAGRRGDAADVGGFRQLVESRDAQFGAQAGVAYAEGLVVRQPARGRTLLEGGHGVNIGIVCYASVGGSGVVATELGKALARRGHQVHFISTETPFRLGDYQEGLLFHQVVTPTYPLFREPQYLLSLANKIVQVAREFSLDVIHAHYAVPHATAAFLAQQVHRCQRPASRRHASSRRCTAPTSRWSATIPSYSRDRGVLDRAIRWRDRGVRKPARRQPRRSWA